MGAYVAKRTVQLMARQGKDIVKSRVLVMGATFKENVEDIRNSKVADVVNELTSFGVHVDIIDPHADSDELKHEYGFGLTKEPYSYYDAIVLAVSHKEYSNRNESYFQSMAAPNAVFIDVKGIYRNKIKNLQYWSL
jgi:UDP-N-acetyl-D-galactosamine dehydrogenase